MAMDFLSLLSALTGGTGAAAPTQSTALPATLDPSIAQASQAQRELAKRRRGRGAYLLNGATGLDEQAPEAAGSLARRLLMGGV